MSICIVKKDGSVLYFSNVDRISFLGGVLVLVFDSGYANRLAFEKIEEFLIVK